MTSISAAQSTALLDDPTPGPSDYKITSAMKCIYRSSPGYTMASRYRSDDFHTQDQKPGPGAYKITEPKCYKWRAPEYSMTPRRYVKYVSPLDDQCKQ